jgi:hypothetical protein
MRHEAPQTRHVMRGRLQAGDIRSIEHAARVTAFTNQKEADFHTYLAH